MNICRNIAISLMVSAASVASAGPIDKARRLYKDGDYEEVVENMG